MQSDQPLLTIAIPTFNRNAQLNVTLAALLPQVTDSCKLLIIDNMSENPVADSSRHLLEQFPLCRVSIIRNRCNIGANANVMRCFEFSDTEYLWVLSDDDQVATNAIGTIFESIQRYPNSIFFNFKSEMAASRRNSWLTQGVIEMIDTFDSFSNLLFISTSVFHLKSLRANLHVGYHNTYSMGPHLATLLSSLGNSGECAFLELQVVSWLRSDDGVSWPTVPQSLGVMTLTELPLPWNARRALGRKINQTRLPLIKLLPSLVTSALVRQDARSSMYLFQQIRWRSWPFDSVLVRLWYWTCGLMLRAPRLTFKLWNLIRRFVFKKEPRTLEEGSLDRL